MGKAIKTVGELIEKLEKCPQDHKILFSFEGRELEISDYIGGVKGEDSVFLFNR